MQTATFDCSAALEPVHPSWLPLLQPAIHALDPDYWLNLKQTSAWLPGIKKIFNAFSLPLANTRVVLFGESPYPRPHSANGYAFWDASVTTLWSDTGLAKSVNRATSLRNFIKMLLVSRGDLSEDDVSQTAIQAIPKINYVQTNAELFQNLLKHGFLLLNACLVLSERRVTQEAKYWQPFINTLLTHLYEKHPEVELLLFGHVAHSIQKIPIAGQFPQLITEHPYNISFIHNPAIQQFFKPFNLLQKDASYA